MEALRRHNAHFAPNSDMIVVVVMMTAEQTYSLT
jgi:hypothetical protein